ARNARGRGQEDRQRRLRVRLRRQRHRRRYARLPRRQPFGARPRQDALRSGKRAHGAHPRTRLVEGASLAHLARKKGTPFAEAFLRCLHARALLPLFCKDEGHACALERKRIKTRLPHKLSAGGLFMEDEVFFALSALLLAEEL